MNASQRQSLRPARPQEPFSGVHGLAFARAAMPAALGKVVGAYGIWPNGFIRQNQETNILFSTSPTTFSLIARRDSKLGSTDRRGIQRQL